MQWRNLKWLIVAVAFALPIAFALFTNHAWEDYYITLRSSRNLLEGNGLVYNAGDRLHTFTSPLGVLIPALCTWLSGPDHEQTALWIFRVFNATLLAATAALLWRRSQTLKLGPVGRFVLFGMLFLDPKLIDFSTNGQEAGILLFFGILLWSELEAPGGPRARWLAVALGGLMWTRPDAFVLAGAIILPHFWLNRRSDGAYRVRWAVLLRGVLFGGLLYLPWFAWAWWYYGSPIPNTIIAKAAVNLPRNVLDLVLLPLTLLGPTSHLDGVFLPAYWKFGGWMVCVVNFGHALALAAVFAWVFPQLPAAGRRVSLALFAGALYLCAIYVYPWYFAPWTALASISLAFWADWAWALATKAMWRWARPALTTVCFTAVAFEAMLLACVTWEMRVQQRVIEDGGRKIIGEWLRANAAPSDRIFLEPLGYVGYYSHLKAYDYPGLSSREVVTAIREGATTYPELIAQLKPDWLILRPSEIEQQGITNANTRAHYRVAKVIDHSRELKAIPFLPGRGWLEYDSQFVVFQRMHDAEAEAKVSLQ
jgi:hypothetical protein